MIPGVENIAALSLSRGLPSQALDGAGKAQESAAATSASGPQASFAATLGDMAGDMAGQLRNAEKVSFDALNGKASTREAVDAVMSAQQSLQTALAVRDKIVSAYLEISRMTI